MRTKVVAMMGVLVIGWALSVPGQASAAWLTGSTFTAYVDDSPLGTNFSQTVTLGPGTTTLDVGEMTLTQTIVPVNASSQWLVLDFEATNGGLLAGNSSAFWEIEPSGVQTTVPAYLTGLIFYWTVNGVAANPIFPFAGFNSIEPNPINPALGPVYGYSYPASGTPATSFYSFAYNNPYSTISHLGLDPTAVNGFTIGMLESDAVPEPSSLCLVAIGAVVLGGFRLARRKGKRA